MEGGGQKRLQKFGYHLWMLPKRTTSHSLHNLLNTDVWRYFFKRWQEKYSKWPEFWLSFILKLNSSINTAVRLVIWINVSHFTSVCPSLRTFLNLYASHTSVFRHIIESDPKNWTNVLLQKICYTARNNWALTRPLTSKKSKISKSFKNFKKVSKISKSIKNFKSFKNFQKFQKISKISKIFRNFKNFQKFQLFSYYRYHLPLLALWGKSLFALF